MAPKKNAKGKKQATIVAKPSPVAPTSAFDAFVDTKFSQAVEETTAKTKSLKLRVIGKLNHHFPRAAPAMIYLRRSLETKLTLFDRVMRDTQKRDSNAPDKPCMGKEYWADRRKEYEDEKDAAEYARFIIQDESELDDNVMKSALAKFSKNSNKADDLNDWCDSVLEVNQKNFTVLLKVLWTVYPGQGVHLARLAGNVLKMIKRLDLHSKFPDTFAIMKDYFDMTLEKLLASYASVQGGSLLWWELVQHFSDTVLDNAAFQILFSADPKKEFSDCPDTLKQVAQGSKTGKLLTAKAMVRLGQTELKNITLKTIASLSGTDLTETALAALRKKFQDELAKNGISLTMLPAPTTTPLYRGVVTHPVPVASPLDFFNTHLEAFLRGCAVNMGLVDPLWFEDAVATDKSQRVTSIAASLLAPIKVGRQLARGFTVEKTVVGLRAVLEKKGKFILSKDPKFKIDLAFWNAMLGEGADEKHLAAVFGCFGDDEYPDSFGFAKTRFLTLQESLFMKVCGEVVAATVETCIDILSVLVAGGIPDWSKLASVGTHEAKLKKKFLDLVTHKAHANGAVKRGSAAIVARFALLEDSIKKEPKPAYKDQIVLRQFFNFMDQDMAVKAKQMIDSLAQGTEGGAASGSGASAPIVDVQPGKVGNKKKRKMSLDLDAINDLFKNPAKKPPKSLGSQAALVSLATIG